MKRGLLSTLIFQQRVCSSLSLWVSRDSCGTLLPEGSVPGSLGGWNNFSHKHWV